MAVMNPPRVTLSNLAALVAVVAVNLWFGRSLWGLRSDHLLVVIVTGPALQVGLLLAFLKRGLTRAFWLGFVLTCSAAIASLYQAITRPFSPSWHLWTAYFDFAQFSLRRLSDAPYLFNPTRSPDLGISPWELTFAAILSVPQLTAALAGGLLALLIAKWRGPTAPGDVQP